MDIRKLQRVIVDGLEDVKAQNIVVFNTEHLSALFERPRQTRARTSGNARGRSSILDTPRGGRLMCRPYRTGPHLSLALRGVSQA